MTTPMDTNSLADPATSPNVKGPTYWAHKEMELIAATTRTGSLTQMGSGQGSIMEILRSSTHDVSLSKTPSSNSFHNTWGSNPFVVHTMTTYSVQPEEKSSRRDVDKKTGADVWVSAVR
jgi:hypothetical protein